MATPSSHKVAKKKTAKDIEAAEQQRAKEELRQKLSDESAEQVLREEQERRQRWLSGVPLFATVASEQVFLAAVAEKFEVQTVGRREFVVKKGDVGTEMFFIVRGEAEVLSSVSKPPFAQLKRGQFFGEAALLEGGGERNAFVRAKTSLQVYSLTKARLEGVFAAFPSVEAAIMQGVRERREAREADAKDTPEPEPEPHEGLPPAPAAAPAPAPGSGSGSDDGFDMIDDLVYSK